LTYRRARSRDRLLEWMEPSGAVRSLRNVAAEYQEVRFSPDGTRLLLVIAEGSQADVWVYDLDRDAMTRVTFYEDNDWAPIWSPDGKFVVYSSWRPDVGTFNLFVQRASGGGTPQRLTTSRNRQMAVEWHPQGKQVLFSEERPGRGSDLMLLPIDLSGDTVKAGTPQPLLDFPSNELAGEFSPDGRWLAYTSDRTGRNEVFVQPFPGRDGGRWQVSTEGAEWVEWRSNGNLFYGRSEEVVMRVPYRVDGTTFLHERPQVWMRIPAGVSWVEPSLDGSRAVGIRSVDARPEAMVLIVNFFEHLRRVAPISR
jgi:Tol biopolymer transport system component